MRKKQRSIYDFEFREGFLFWLGFHLIGLTIYINNVHPERFLLWAIFSFIFKAELFLIISAWILYLGYLVLQKISKEEEVEAEKPIANVKIPAPPIVSTPIQIVETSKINVEEEEPPPPKELSEEELIEEAIKQISRG